jgi:hypothetical protein
MADLPLFSTTRDRKSSVAFAKEVLMPASPVAAIAAASPERAAEHFAARLSFETDCADVHASLLGSAEDFVLLDVRGPNAYGRAHVPGALNLPWRDMTAERMSAWPRETLFVVYCAGPHLQRGRPGGPAAVGTGASGQTHAGRRHGMGRRGLRLRLRHGTWSRGSIIRSVISHHGPVQKAVL